MVIPCLQNRSSNRAHLFSGCAITLKRIIFSHLRQIEKRAPSFMIKHVVTTGPRQRPAVSASSRSGVAVTAGGKRAAATEGTAASEAVSY